MAKTVSSASVISTSLQEMASGNEGASNNSGGLTYKGMNVYAAGYCPVCHQITKVKTSDGAVIDVVSGDETVPQESVIIVDGESSSESTDNIKKYNNTTTNDTSTVPAANVVEDSQHMFVTQEILQSILTVISQYMSKIIYDQDNDGIVDMSKTTKSVSSVSWNAIKDVPDPLTDLQGLKNLLIHHHHHRNMKALRKIGEDDKGNPIWDNKEWPYPQTAKANQLSARYMRNIFIALSDPKNAEIGDIWLEVETFDSPLIKGLYIKKEDGTWYRWLADDIKDAVIDQIQRAIRNLSHENLKNLYGGDAFEHYHVTEDEHGVIVEIVASFESGNRITTITKSQYLALMDLIKSRKLTHGEYIGIQKFLRIWKNGFPNKWENIDDDIDYSDIDESTTDLTKDEYYTILEIIKMCCDREMMYESSWIGVDGYTEDYSSYPDLDEYILTENQIDAITRIIKWYDKNKLEVEYDWYEGGELM